MPFRPYGTDGRPLPLPIVIAALLVPPILFAMLGTPHGHSYLFNILWQVEVDDQLAKGVFPPRHLPGLWAGFGGLDMFFYGPLPFWFGSAAGRLFCWGCAPATVLALSAGLTLSLSMLSFGVFARRFVPPVPAALAAVIYAILPYHLVVDWTWRLAVGEFGAYVFLPLVAAGMDIVLRERRLSSMLPFGVAGLCLTHLPTMLLAGHVFLAVFAAWAWINRKTPRDVLLALGRLTLLVAIGIFLSAAVWLPAVVHIADVSASVLFDEYFSPEVWLLGFSLSMASPGMVLAVVACVLLGVLITYGVWKLPTSALPPHVAIWIFVPVIFSLVLMTQLATPIWRYWIISAVQFPWRLLVFVDLAMGLAAAVIVQLLLAGRMHRLPALMSLCMVAMVNLALFAIRPDTLEGSSQSKAAVLTSGAVEYLPPDMFAVFAERAGGRDRVFWSAGQVLPGYLEDSRKAVSGYNDFRLDSRTATVMPSDGATAMVLPMPYWLHWQAEGSGGQALALGPDPELGLMQVRSTGGEAIRGPVVIEIPWLWSEKAGAALSVLGLLALVASMIAERRRRRGAVL